jgi:hypothetical protein
MLPRSKRVAFTAITLVLAGAGALGGWCIAGYRSGAVAQAPSATTAESQAATAALAKACAYLWSQQAADGGWHSAQYAVMRSGQALTPFVLHALLDAPESIAPRPAGGGARALDFIRRHVDEHGALGHADPDIVEYPVYSTSYALRCLVAVKHEPALAKPTDAQLMSSMFNYLSTAQFNETKGFDTNNPAYGGWGLDMSQGNGNPGHMDLAHTRRALQALRAYVDCIGDVRRPEFTRAELFLRVVQRDPAAIATPRRVLDYLFDAQNIPFDGGFFFSPVVDQANKAGFSATSEGKAAPHFLSYATATCDGILGLLATGVDRHDERLVRAVEWLRAHDDPGYPQGIPTDRPEPWGDAIHFYHFAVRAEAYAALGWPGDWPLRLADAVAKEQSADGSFRNAASPLMKEDDPLLATALATVALTHCAK